MNDSSSLALLASLVEDKSEGASPSPTAGDHTSAADDGDEDLVAVMDEFRRAPDSRAALASLRAIVRRLQEA